MKTPVLVGTLLLGMSVVIGCSVKQAYVGSPEPRVAERPPAVWEGEKVAIAVRPKTGAEESAAFGVDLHARDILSMEIKLTYRDTLGKARIRIRRHDVRLSFSNGTERFALDPGKIYERTRINVTGAALAFGLIGTMIASSSDKGRRGQFMEVAIQEKTVDAQQREAAGLLFFDMTGLGAVPPTACMVEYEELSTGMTGTAVIALP